MIVLIIMPSGKSRGGAEEALVQLVERRSELPFEVHLMFLESGDLVERLKRMGAVCEVIEAKRLSNLYRLTMTVCALSRVIKKIEAAAVIAWMTKAHVYGGLAAWWNQVPAICFQMGLPDGGRVDRLSRLIPSAGILSCSEYAARMQRQVSRECVMGVPLGMDERRFEISNLPSVTEAKRRLGFDPEKPLIGIVGRLQRWKGIHLFLAAMAEVLQKHPEARGVVVGGQHDLEPDYPAFLERERARLNLEDWVRMAGAQRNVPEWMQAMDIIVHASEREPFGIVVVEAMALGKAVVASIPGGPEEIIEHEMHGLLVQCGDVNALAGAITRFLDDSVLANRCGKAARARSKEFTATHFVKRFSEKIVTMLGNRSNTTKSFFEVGLS